MADFDANSKRTSAVFMKQVRDGKTVYIREPYNLVCYNYADGKKEFTAIEGQAQPYIGGTPSGSPVEQYDEILIVDRPLFGGINRFGNN